MRGAGQKRQRPEREGPACGLLWPFSVHGSQGCDIRVTGLDCIIISQRSYVLSLEAFGMPARGKKPRRHFCTGDRGQIRTDGCFLHEPSKMTEGAPWQHTVTTN